MASCEPALDASCGEPHSLQPRLRAAHPAPPWSSTFVDAERFAFVFTAGIADSNSRSYAHRLRLQRPADSASTGERCHSHTFSRGDSFGWCDRPNSGSA